MALFDATALQPHIDRALADLPSGHNRALVGTLAADGTGLEVRVAYQVDGRWQIGGVIRRERDRGWSGGVRVLRTWRA